MGDLACHRAPIAGHGAPRTGSRAKGDGLTRLHAFTTLPGPMYSPNSYPCCIEILPWRPDRLEGGKRAIEGRQAAPPRPIESYGCPDDGPQDKRLDGLDPAPQPGKERSISSKLA